MGSGFGQGDDVVDMVGVLDGGLAVGTGALLGLEELLDKSLAIVFGGTDLGSTGMLVASYALFVIPSPLCLSDTHMVLFQLVIGGRIFG